MKKREYDWPDETIARQGREQALQGTLHQRASADALDLAGCYRDLFDNAIDALIVCDRDGTILLINRRAEALFGYPRQEMTDRSCSEFFSPSTAPLVLQRVDHSVAGETVLSWEAEVVRKDGSRIPVAVRSGALPIRSDQTPHVQMVLQDISQKKSVERQRTDFLEMLAHDIRSPLSVVVGYADLLLSEAKLRASREEVDMLLSLRSGAFSLSTLVMNYLDVAKIETRPLIFAKGAVALQEVIRRVGRQYSREAQRLHIDLDFSLTDDLPAVMGDALALERVVTNLVHNALKFTPARGKVTVSTFTRGEDKVGVSVVDSGPGMTPEEIAVVFEKYRTAKKDRKREGSGLGLFIVKALVEAHGGRVEVESIVGEGTCMSIIFPKHTN
ncbi:MAG: HAMP domain-containing histidine kinase [Deltaproteobacteria bacterium]|nr:HAMP domain-containing histidine kinase [Deltaproteobacteria bacterium]